MKKGSLWVLSVLAGTIVLFSVMIIGYYILNSSNEPVATTVTNQSATKASETSSTTTTSSTENITEPVSEQGMNISEMKRGNFSSVQGTWFASDGAKFIIASDGSVNEVQYITDIRETVPDGSIATAYLVNKSNVGKSYLLSFILASSGSKEPECIVLFDDDDNNGLSGQTYYRDLSASSEQDTPTATEKDYMMAYAIDTIEKYRKDVNKSLAERKDYIADSFTSKDNSYYLETVDYILNQSAKDGIKSYDSTTDSITDFQYTKYTITFTLNYTTTTNYTDGRPSTTNSFTRYYTLKYIDGVFSN
uniref:DUF6287 domain-containing protein n=1 Tax=Streptococcus pluranimalium TaxID=82348 RepID=UPI003F693F22